MADDLIYPVRFDLEKGVTEAGKEWDSKYADKLEKLIQKRAFNVKLKFDTRALDNLDDVKRRLAELKITPITPENKATIKELVRELKELARIMEKIQRFKGIELPELQMAKAAKLRKDVEQANEKLRLSQERVRQAEERLILSQKRAETQAYSTGRSYETQSTYLNRLIKRMAVYASVGMVGEFLTKVREVTAEFEVQRVSLGAILQSQIKADQLFTQLKGLALRSPVSLLDLTKYTKQLAAYKIGYEELFETTKKLTDVSVGLGVSMDRVVLAYGQVRATGHLRASEVRQFTEMGVPIVEELATKLTRMNGELVTSAQVMDMISKRAISFDMVKDVFDDMTEKGGIFYNMQEKQADTLYGMWAKLGDAVSIMYEKIGTTGVVNSAMKGLINLLISAMKHVNSLATVVFGLVAAFGVQRLATKVATASTLQYTASGKKLLTVKKMQVVEAMRVARATKDESLATRIAAAQTLAVAKAKLKAARATNILTKSMYGLKAAFLSNPFGWVITGISLALPFIFKMDDEIKGLESSLAEINTKYQNKTQSDSRNFTQLASTAVGSADGSKAQKEALDELNRTYGEILGSENLQIERLRAMKGEYGALTDMIEAYNLKMKHQEKESAINDVWDSQIKKDFEKILNLMGADSYDFLEQLREKVVAKLQENGRVTKEDLEDIVAELGVQWHIVKEIQEGIVEYLSDSSWVKAQNAKADALKRESIEYENASAAANKYQSVTDTLAKSLQDIRNGEFSASSVSGITGVKSQGEELIIQAEAYKQQAAAAKNLADSMEEMGTKGAEGADKLRSQADSYTKAAQDLIEQAEALKNATAGANGILSQEWDLSNTQDQVNLQIDTMALTIQEALRNAGVKVDEGFFQLKDSFTKGETELASINFQGIIDAISNANIDEGLKGRLLNMAEQMQKMYVGFAPTNLTERVVMGKLNKLNANLNVSAYTVQKYAMKAGESLSDYRKRLEDELSGITDSIARAQLGIRLAKMFGESNSEVAKAKKQLDELTKEKKLLEGALGTVGHTPSKSRKKRGSGGHKSDTRLQELQEMWRTLKAINKEYDDLSKREGSGKAGAWVKDNYEPTLKLLNGLAGKFKLKFDFPLTPENLQKYGNEIAEKIKSLKLKGGEKAAVDLQLELDKDAQARFEKELEAELKRLADRISRTKTAKEFYEKILGMTGDVKLAANLSLSIYGENGEDLNKAIRENIQATLGKDKEGKALDISAAVRSDGSTDYNELVRLSKGYLDAGEIAEETYNKILKMREEDRKDMAKTVEGWLKATEKAKNYSDKLLDLRRKTQAEIEKINTAEEHGDISPDYAKSQREGFLRKEAEEVSKLQYEAFKDSPMYVQMFDDLDNASTTMLKNMKERLKGLQGEWKNLTPTQLKEMQSRLNEIDKQLAKRNPFGTLAASIKKYRDMRRKGDDYGYKSEEEANKALDAANQNRLDAEKEYLEILHEVGATQEEIAEAKKRLDDATEDEAAAAKAVENWKKVNDTIVLSADELLQMLDWAGDIAKAGADISEAMGADAEDVQYWNDIADALSQISGGIQDIVKSAMSGNVIGVVSSALSAVPKMFTGFVNLFSAGKIRRANKEIRKQGELLKELEYTYGRLEKAADKAFGRDYLSNHQRLLANLQAQQSAYQKQAEAEYSKGKKRDKDKIKEYENQARETADKIKELQDDLVAHFAGSSRADLAKQMARSWVEARISMSDTFAAIKGDYAEMIKNMIVEGAAARVVENALSPLWSSLESMLGDNDMDGAIDALINGMDSALNAANNGMEALWSALEAKGYDMKRFMGDSDSEYTGIAKSVSGSSSEEINNVAAIGNTLLYYVSPIPRIDENLARVVALMEGGGSSTITQTASAGWTDWQQQAMDNYIAIQRNTADTVVECRRAAVACEKITKLIKTNGATTGLNVWLNS